MIKTRISEVGKTFGSLTVIADAPSRKTPCGSVIGYSLCKCDCGTVKEIATAKLRSGRTVSCGCAKKKRIGSLNKTHGKTRTKIYLVCQNMLKRCNYEAAQNYHWYGERGIKVCERWKDFNAFLADMGEPPVGHWIDRKNNNGNYEPNNCRWATPKEQAANRRKPA